MVEILLAAILAALAPVPSEGPQAAPPAATRSSQMSHAVGTFDVQITPVEPGEADEALGHGRLRIAKTFHGDLQGTSAGEMLATMDDGQSGAYVALERVSATLGGRSGAFTLAHRGIMDRGAQDLLITIVPGSGVDGLTGISGVFHLTIVGGEHRYDLEYDLPEDAR